MSLHVSALVLAVVASASCSRFIAQELPSMQRFNMPRSLRKAPLEKQLGTRS